MSAVLKPKAKFETNEEFITRIMNWGCPTGALVQPFIIQALTTYSNMVINAGPKECDSSMLSGEAWVATAAFMKKELDAKYGA